MRTPIDVAIVDEVIAELHATTLRPGVAYGVVVDGRLVHSGGLGGLTVGGPTPDADSVFRIASMTKSFTAACLLGLRDEGAVRLDDPVARYVPELTDLRGPTADSAPVTVRDLLTMSAGFPTDDPWGDRQVPLSYEGFSAMLRSGFSFEQAPGLAFEYSNLGYAILGRVVAAAAGEDYRRAVESRVLEPLHLAATAFDTEQIPVARLAVGHRERDGAWAAVPFAAHGEFASMAGLFSSVRDLARWVGGFTDAFPPRDDATGPQVLSRATRREMQQVHRLMAPLPPLPNRDGPPAPLAAGYGFGLFVEHDPHLGVIVGHPGGLPGFGSAMRWHPASRVGVIVLANATYWPAPQAAAKALDAVLAAGAPKTCVAPWPETTAARAAVMRLLAHWDSELADRVFAENVDMDEPLARRRAAIERLKEQTGPLGEDPSAPVEIASPANVTWWLRGTQGRVKVRIGLSPERTPRIQTLELTAVPDPPAELRRIAGVLAAALAADAPAWPSRELEAQRDADIPAFNRALCAAAAAVGTCRLGEAVDGDGRHSATFRLTGEHGDLDLSLTIAPDTNRVSGLSLAIANLGGAWTWL